MSPIARLLVALGIVLIIAGLAWQFGGKYLHLGRLPGDVVIEQDGFKLYFPIVTCLVLSALVTAVFWAMRFFSGK